MAKTLWGTEVGTASAAIDIVMMESDRPLSHNEIQAEVRRRDLPTRQSASSHLSTLKKRGCIDNQDGKWFKTLQGQTRQPVGTAADVGGSARNPATESTAADFAVAPTPEAADLDGPPADRVNTMISRIVRDTRLAAWVKRKHNQRCQICGETVRLADGSGYAEGHHLHPLGKPHDGPDVIGNIVCLCPNHHAACDFGAIKLDIALLRVADGHRVGKQFIDYHNEKIFRGQ